MVYRVIQWGTGTIGKHTLRAVIDHPQLELVGVKVYSQDKIGFDAGAIVGLPDTGIKAVVDMNDLPLANADCVLYIPMLPNYDEISQLLRAGVNVITTAGNLYPKSSGMEIVDKIQNACLAGNSVFHGSGINPAFMSEVLPLTLSGLSYRAKRITVQEVSDVRLYAAQAPEIMMNHLGFGKSPAEALRPDNPFIAWMSGYFRESMDMIVDHLGVKLEKVIDNHQVAIAKSRVVISQAHTIEPGTVACRRFEWQGIVNGTPAIILRTYWKTTMDIESAWPIGSEKEVEWTITVEGTPSYQCKVSTCASFDSDNPKFGQGGEVAAVIGTGMHAVNAIPYVCKAQPGIRTFLDLPIIGSFGGLQ
ncbi:MAG: dihydrodipicolinate reductase [Nevskia sp.]|nr:dihydrodipicolinate reductase [Nevskia sp.]